MHETEDAEVIIEEFLANEKSDKKETKGRTVRSRIQNNKSEHEDIEGFISSLTICFKRSEGFARF